MMLEISSYPCANMDDDNRSILHIHYNGSAAANRDQVFINFYTHNQIVCLCFPISAEKKAICPYTNSAKCLIWDWQFISIPCI